MGKKKLINDSLFENEGMLHHGAGETYIQLRDEILEYAKKGQFNIFNAAVEVMSNAYDDFGFDKEDTEKFYEWFYTDLMKWSLNAKKVDINIEL